MWEHVANLASLELMFHLHWQDKTCNISGIMSEMLLLDVSLPSRFNINDLCILQSTSINNIITNIKQGRNRLVQCLQGFFEPGIDQMLYEWLTGSKLYTKGARLEASNFELEKNSHKNKLSLEAVYILRQITYSHKLSLPNTLSLWASFNALILLRPIDKDNFISLSTLWNHIQCLHYIDNAVATDRFEPFIGSSTFHQAF